MRRLLDMNLAPCWVEPLHAAGHEAVHWSAVGDPKAGDAELMDFARGHDYIVVTHDLDFGDILAATGGKAPSVIRIRSDNLTPEHLVARVLTVLEQCQDALAQGALVSIDLDRHRLRMPPLGGVG